MNTGAAAGAASRKRWVEAPLASHWGAATAQPVIRRVTGSERGRSNCWLAKGRIGIWISAQPQAATRCETQGGLGVIAGIGAVALVQRV